MVFNRSQDKQGESDFTVPGLHDDEQTEAPSSDDTIGYIVSNQSLMSSLLENLASYDNVQLETEIKAKVIRKVVSLLLENSDNTAVMFSVLPKGQREQFSCSDYA